MNMRDLFEYKTNPFKGVLISPDSLPESSNEFDDKLNKAISHWQKEGLMTVWLEVPVEKSALIPVAVVHGFTFHHCTEQYLMLTHKLVANAFIPPYATHYAGTGGVVLNQNQELLVVVEKNDRVNRPNYYKLPGGTLNAGEHIVDAAIREVQEETGVLTQFESMVCFRHWHNYRHGKSDFYFVCRLSPIEEAISIQEMEIHKCQWMPVHEFLANESVGIFSKRIVETALQGNGMIPGWLEGYDKDPATREIFLSLDITNGPLN